MDEEGPDFIAWLGEYSVPRGKITIHAGVISQLLLADVDTRVTALKFWQGVPQALSHESPETFNQLRDSRHCHRMRGGFRRRLMLTTWRLS